MAGNLTVRWQALEVGQGCGGNAELPDEAATAQNKVEELLFDF
jgi:hypothetical protein